MEPSWWFTSILIPFFLGYFSRIIDTIFLKLFKKYRFWKFRFKFRRRFKKGRRVIEYVWDIQNNKDLLNIYIGYNITQNNMANFLAGIGIVIYIFYPIIYNIAVNQGIEILRIINILAYLMAFIGIYGAFFLNSINIFGKAIKRYMQTLQRNME